LITALNTYVTNYNQWNAHQHQEAWVKVGKAQRDVPAHVAHEYCRPDRSFALLPSFNEATLNEATLPRILTVDNYVTNAGAWFPLSSSSSGLGFDFAFIRCGQTSEAWGCLAPPAQVVVVDLAAIRHLDEVRIAAFTHSHENLSRPPASKLERESSLFVW
jgi:hypothetical protein